MSVIEPPVSNASNSPLAPVNRNRYRFCDIQEEDQEENSKDDELIKSDDVD